MSKNLRTYSYLGGKIGAKILRLPSVAQDDTVISMVLLIKADNHNYELVYRRAGGLPPPGFYAAGEKSPCRQARIAVLIVLRTM